MTATQMALAAYLRAWDNQLRQIRLYRSNPDFSAEKAARWLWMLFVEIRLLDPPAARLLQGRLR